MLDQGTSQQQLAEVYQRESRRVLATLIRLLGSFDLAEEALHDAFMAAATQWPGEGVPDNPRAWLVSTGRFKAIDQLRRRARFDESQQAIADTLYQQTERDLLTDDDRIEDDRLRLIFTCCHPGLSTDAQVALTLREVCDLTTEEIARAYLTTTSTLAQRIVRAKRKIQAARIPYEVPGPAEFPARLQAVLHVIYLVFNEGYSATAGPEIQRRDLSAEAIRLGYLLQELLPDPEVNGLLGLMLVHQARQVTRTTPDGDLILLEDQDRSRWDTALIEEGAGLIRRALSEGPAGPYALQAAIAALHAEAPSWEATDWVEIVGLYDLLLQVAPSPVVALNRAAAVAMRDGWSVGLELMDQLRDEKVLEGYHLLPAARAHLLSRLGRDEEARGAYREALSLVQQEPERRYLQRRLDALQRSESG
ncbi:RNA polymerase sigma factor [Marinimicrobium sp. C6131]|uniref:RNA polymerase sigma factor n=1 Tax=Marinimicrobium sp. C6131 TaxID=3022676 RepID=UPI00223E60DA|nr:RNA polymerase sigma factor [Marinimicrobium sp. C6131]UZJ43551.1 RNA polymerase sigma factor [Marinimicrobium sp. C6131]